MTVAVEVPTVDERQRTACLQSVATALDSTLCLLVAFRELGRPKSLIDVGCGRGHLVRAASALGVLADGVDIAVEPEELPLGGRLIRHDLTRPWRWNPAEWVLCWETAEHLPEASADILCDTLDAVTGDLLLFTAATPGQGGSGHVNEQPHDYWRGKLQSKGLCEDVGATSKLRRLWAEVAKSAWWYPRNLIAFRRWERRAHRRDGW